MIDNKIKLILIASGSAFIRVEVFDGDKDNIGQLMFCSRKSADHFTNIVRAGCLAYGVEIEVCEYPNIAEKEKADEHPSTD